MGYSSKGGHGTAAVLVDMSSNALYEGVGLGSTSAASSLYYQYVPSKVSPFLMHSAMPIYNYLSV